MKQALRWEEWTKSRGRGVGAGPCQTGGMETTGRFNMRTGQVSENKASNCLHQDFVSDTEEKGGPRKGCHEFSRGAVSEREGDSLEEKLVGIRTGKAQRLPARWRSSDPGGTG